MGVIEDFHKRHGDDFIESNGWILWPDGAHRENALYGPMVEPSDDPHQRAKQVRMYWELRLGRAVSEFDDFHRSLRAAAQASIRDGAAAPDDSSLEELTRLKKKIVIARAALEAAETEVENTVPEQIRLHQAAIESRRQAGQKFAEKLSKIEV